MESISILKFFFIATLVLWVFLLIVTVLMSNRGLLNKRGYSEGFISFMNRDYMRRGLMIAIFVPLIQVAAYFVTDLFVEDASSRIELVALVFIVMIMPFPVIDNIATGKKLRSVIADSSGVMVIDLKHKVLNIIYNPVLEAVLTLITVLYALIVTKPVILFYLHIVLPWLFYLTARRTQKTIRAHLKDGYLWAFVFITINFALIVYYLVASLSGKHSVLNSWQLTAGILLVITLVARIIYYLLNYPLVRRKLEDNS